METYTLLVWNENPESLTFYLIPNNMLSKRHIALMEEAHNRMINSDESNDGMNFLAVALVPESSKGDDSLFTEHNIPDDYCLFAGYKQKSDDIITKTITRVISSGFYL